MYLSRAKLFWLGYLIVGFILLLGTNEQRLQKANLISISVYYPLISSINQIEEIFTLRERNKELIEKVAHYKTFSNTLSDDLSYIESVLKLRTHDDFQYGDPLDFVISSVIAYKGSFTNRTLVIDKGHLDGIEKGYPVISEDGIVGKIVNVFPKHAIVLPITSPHFKLGIINKNNSVQGLLEADVSGNIFMTMIPSGSQFSVGDTLMTSTVSTIFPSGYPVGTVSRIFKVPEDVYLQASVQPYTEINNLEQVIVLFFKKDLPIFE